MGLYIGLVHYPVYNKNYRTIASAITTIDLHYMARLATVFQQSKPDIHVALMAPIEDVWSDRGLDRNIYNTTPWYLHSIWHALNHN